MESNENQISGNLTRSAESIKSIWIDFSTAAEATRVARANQIIVQNHGDEVFLNFFAFSPLVTVGDRAAQIRQLGDREKITPECTARLAVSKTFITDMIEALQAHITMMEAQAAEETDEDA